MMMLANNIYVIKPTHCTLLLQRKMKSIDLNTGEQQGSGWGLFFQKAPFDKVTTDGKDRVDNNADNVENVTTMQINQVF